jgi:hypothetical protein
MELNVPKEVAALQRMGVKKPRARYAEVFGETTTAANKTWLVRRLAWRLQALAEGDLSERARRRAAELANDADLRMNPPRTKTADTLPEVIMPAVLPLRDRRLPPTGTVLVRKYRGGNVQVKVLTAGFAFEGVVYPSLSAVAKAVTGAHCDGFLFFKVGQHGDDR